MLKIKELQLENIGRFVGKHTINLSNAPKFIQVDAKNLNTGGSSGSGKSTIFNAIDYLFGINATPATVLQSRLTKDKMRVTAIIESDGVEYKLSRTAGSGLSITNLNTGFSIENSNKVAEEELDKIIGLPRNILRMMYHKKQKEGGFFLNLTPKQSHEFLSECLGLIHWNKKQDAIQLKVSELEKELERLDYQISVAEASLERNKSSLEMLSKPLLTVGIVENRQQLVAKLQVTKQEFEERLAVLKTQLQAIPMPTLDPIPPVPESLLLLKDELSAIDKEINLITREKSLRLSKLNDQKEIVKNALSAIHQKMSLIPRLESELEQKKLFLIKIKNSECPTCGQIWNNSSATDCLNEKIKEAKALSDQISEYRQEALKEPELQKILEQINEQIQEILSSNNDELMARRENIIDQIEAAEADHYKKVQEIQHVNSQKLTEYRAKQSDIQSNIDQLSHRYLTDIRGMEAAIKEMDLEISEYEFQLKNYEFKCSSIMNEMTENKSLIEKFSNKIKDIHVQIAEYKEAIRFIKSYVNQLFQSSLQIISNNASTMLAKISNSSTITVSFDAFKQSKNGAIKEEVTPIVSIDGDVGIPITSLSGGERTAVDLALDLSVIDMVEYTTGKGIDLFILDEPFNGLDQVSIEACLEIIKHHDTNKRIIIVDHSSETKEAVGHRIVVVRDGQESHIQC